MLLHARIPLLDVELLHVVTGLVFLIISVVHLVLNRRVLRHYLGRPSAAVAIGALFLLLLPLVFVGDQERDGYRLRHGQAERDRGETLDADAGAGGESLGATDLAGPRLLRGHRYGRSHAWGNVPQEFEE